MRFDNTVFLFNTCICAGARIVRRFYDMLVAKLDRPASLAATVRVFAELLADAPEKEKEVEDRQSTN